MMYHSNRHTRGSNFEQPASTSDIPSCLSSANEQSITTLTAHKPLTEKILTGKNKIGIANVILHAFDWSYADVAKNAQLISEMGYHSVLVSPPMKSLKHKNRTGWWQRYQPQDYRVIDNQLGNTIDFSEMVKQLAKYDINVYADIVFNHMANEAYKRPDLQYPSTEDMQEYAKHKNEYQSLLLFGDLTKPLFLEEHFVDGFGIKDWKNCWEVQNGRITGGGEDPGLPTLQVCDHVINQQQSYLKALKRLGVKGFRIDAAKHMTLEHLKRVWTEEITENMHVFGEIITDGGATVEEYKIFLQPYLEKTNLGSYDFPLFNTVFKAFQDNGNIESLIDPYCYGQALVNFRAITFVITHDIPNNNTFKNLILSEEDEWLAYAYILGRDGGVPLIYTDLNPSKILNKEGNPRWVDTWKNLRMEKMIKFHHYVHGEPMFPIMTNQDLLIFARGDKGIVAINKSDADTCIDFQWHRTMQDILTEQQFKIESEKLHLILEANSYLMLI
ncbi:alpha-amylase family glycosyl hydrolase [Psychromonas sp. SA13A]|uniref:alpha-amylase family glycosyl hydrolase n=1 Tax=Psychromonas sp. SA13A TaxID=2686346 RepID=UPI0019821EA7|nr:alpha-amylase family glycosyl hydrolase [Psychromonas sp. SA13A]